jgi:Ca2+/Na+ antiporter
MWYAFLVAAGISVLVILIYQIRFMSRDGYKAKFDFASRNEIKSYLRANYILAVGIFFFLNTVYDETVALSEIWLFIRIFVSMCIGTLHIYIAYLVFKYYYPGPLNKKLKRLRYTPRVNPKTGNKMKLLSEEEEDAYLDEGMQAEEDVFSVDYDVWIDPVTEETKIEKYKGHLGALECDRCGFQTLKLQHENVLQKPTEFADGLLEKEYKCSYCGRIKRKTVNLTRNMSRDASTAKMISDPLKKDVKKEVDAIFIEVHGTDGHEDKFEFQGVKQAKKFLEEFDYQKIREK